MCFIPLRVGNPPDRDSWREWRNALNRSPVHHRVNGEINKANERTVKPKLNGDIKNQRKGKIIKRVGVLGPRRSLIFPMLGPHKSDSSGYMNLRDFLARKPILDLNTSLLVVIEQVCTNV